MQKQFFLSLLICLFVVPSYTMEKKNKNHTSTTCPSLTEAFENEKPLFLERLNAVRKKVGHISSNKASNTSSKNNAFSEKKIIIHFGHDATGRLYCQKDYLSKTKSFCGTIVILSEKNDLKQSLCELTEYSQFKEMPVPTIIIEPHYVETILWGLFEKYAETGKLV